MIKLAYQAIISLSLLRYIPENFCAYLKYWGLGFELPNESLLHTEMISEKLKVLSLMNR